LESIAKSGVNFFVDNHLSFFDFAMNAPHLWKLRTDYLSGVGHGATVFVAAFPIVNKL
jgi:hypothetical protein